MQPTNAGTAVPSPSASSIEAARSGDREAIGWVLETCRQYLMMVANRELGRDLRAKEGVSDLVQKTFLAACRNFGRFQGRTEWELQAWLRAILKNDLAHVADRYRRTAKREIGREVAIDDNAHTGLKETLTTEAQTASARAMLREEEEALRRAMARLPRQDREILHWRNRDGESFEQIGRRLHCSADAARKTWTRAIGRLQKEMQCGAA